MTTPDDALPVDVELQRQYAGLARATSGSHPSEDDWVRFADGALDEVSRVRLADHVTACAACADVFRVVVHVREGAPALGAMTSSSGPDRASTAARAWYGLALAATLVLAIAGVARWQARAGAPAAPSQVASSSPEPSAAPATAPFAPSAPDVAAGPRSWAALSVAPAITLPASFALVVRGASAPADAFMTAFGAALVPYREGRYSDAAAALDGVTRRHPDVAEGWFYLGASRLLAGDAVAALAPLERARASTVVAAEARWLEAIALERAGRGADADAALTAMCASDAGNRARACAAAAVMR